MEYIAHTNEKKKEQSIKEHLENTAQLCGKFADSFGAYKEGYCCGLLHDIGKYSAKFQNKIRGAEERVDHSTAGARVCWEKKGMYMLLSYCIAGHHAGLPDTGEPGGSNGSRTMLKRMEKKVEDYQAYTSEIEIPVLKTPPFFPVKSENPDFFQSMFIRMLYSCLVDADYLDTEAFMKEGKIDRNPGESIEILYEKLEHFISGWLANKDVDTINGRRTEILKSCLEKGESDRGLFRLTVPTGGGKTVASLAFALKHAKKNNMDRIIYVIPYTSIIEQNAQVFRDILGKENVLENHCNVEYEPDKKSDDAAIEEMDEELKSMQLAAENWDKPVVVTTNVQFFESLFANKSTKCRKLHNIANSVIIFDEAQMLPNDYLKPCIAAIEQLLRYYRCSIVLCTATQPALKKVMSQDIKAVELCPRMEEQFRFFKRASIMNLGKISSEDLVHRLKQENQALCIVNTRIRAQKIYQEIKGESIYHLSTTMYPIHRKRVLSRIREQLESKKKCVVISTSLVEAGVDLDFQTAYRQLAGVDSMIQAAGRCNREGRRKIGECTANIFRLDEMEYAPGQRLQIDVTKSLLEDKRNLEDLDTIEKYFEVLYHFLGESLDKKSIMERFKRRIFPFATVSKEFKLIEENSKTILITKEPEAAKIYEELKIKGFTKKLAREMGQYCVQVRENDYQKMSAAGMLKPISEEMKEDYFVLTEPEKYTEEMGLVLDAEYGQAVFF